MHFIFLVSNRLGVYQMLHKDYLKMWFLNLESRLTILSKKILSKQKIDVNASVITYSL